MHPIFIVIPGSWLILAFSPLEDMQSRGRVIFTKTVVKSGFQTFNFLAIQKKMQNMHHPHFSVPLSGPTVLLVSVHPS